MPIKQKRFIIALIIVLIVCVIPIKSELKDGGTVKYNAVLYGVTKSHSMWNENKDPNGNFGYLTGPKIRILWFTVYDDVKFVPSDNT